MPIVLALSPHLDDAVFSCGGVLALLGDAGWQTVMATLFTRSVVPAQGFALACQLDKGLAPDVDYMALRRAEDAAAAAILGVTTLRWLDLLEAPHRGYESAPALFAGYAAADAVAAPLAQAMAALQAEFAPDLVLLPQGLGNHVDHRRVIDAARAVFPADRIAAYRDTPYAMRHPHPPAGVPVPIGLALDRKLAASVAYASQVGFQFGGAGQAAEALRTFALAEGDGIAAERFVGASIASASNGIL